MVDVATSPAPATSTKDAGSAPTDAAKDKAAPPSKPERPDDDQYKTDLAKAEKELKASEDKMKQIKSKIDLARPPSKDSPAFKQQKELRDELSSIRQLQQSSKSGRTQVMDKIKRLDENLKARMNEQKVARSKVQFKSVDEVQREIDRLQKQVDTGTMRIVDEKKSLADISQLNRQKKGFAGFDEAEKGIADIKSQISELKKSMDDPESKALSERYTTIITELDKIKAEQDDAYKNFDSLKAERNKAHEDQQKRYSAVKDIKDKYYQSRRAAVDYEREARRIREEKRKVENDAYHRGRRQEVAKGKLEEASAPAYQEEIRIAQNLMVHFDPSQATKQEASGPGKFAATEIRKVEGNDIKGTRLPSKKGEEEEAYFVGGGGKKNKRKGGRAGGAESPAPSVGKFNLDMGTIDSLGKLGVDPPMSQNDVPAVVEKLKEKLNFWKGDQDAKTKSNVAKAQAEIDKLEAEAIAADSKQTNGTEKQTADKQQVNGSSTAGAELTEKDSTDDGTEGVGKAKLDDVEASA